MVFTERDAIGSKVASFALEVSCALSSTLLSLVRVQSAGLLILYLAPLFGLFYNRFS